jgi:hypothetical protein
MLLNTAGIPIDPDGDGVSWRVGVTDDIAVP